MHVVPDVVDLEDRRVQLTLIHKVPHLYSSVEVALATTEADPNNEPILYATAAEIWSSKPAKEYWKSYGLGQ